MSNAHFIQELIEQICDQSQIIPVQNSKDLLSKLDLEAKNLLITDESKDLGEVGLLLPVIEIAKKQQIKNSLFLRTPVSFGDLLKKIDFAYKSLAGSRRTIKLEQDVLFLPSKKMLIILDKNEVLNFDVTQKEVDLLTFLSEAKNGASKDDIQEKVFKYKSDIDSHTVETHIYRIKNKHPLLKKLIILDNKGLYKLNIPDK